MPFPQDDLELLEQTEEVLIATTRPDGTTRRTIIWVMTDDDDVFIRSVRGEQGRWYLEALADPRVTIHAGDRVIAATAVPAPDDDSVARCSAAIHRKYAGVPGERPMLAAKALPTTLRLEPA